MVYAADESMVVVQGLIGYIVAEKNGQQLVCSLKEELSFKEFRKIIKQGGFFINISEHNV